MGNPLVLAGSTGEPWTPSTAVAGPRPMKNRVRAFIMLTLTAIGGAAVVSAIRQRACQRPLRNCADDGLVLLTDSGSGCSARVLTADVRFDRGWWHRRERWWHPPPDPPSPGGSLCSSVGYSSSGKRPDLL
jgi:hypothetical protein